MKSKERLPPNVGRLSYKQQARRAVSRVSGEFKVIQAVLNLTAWVYFEGFVFF